MLSFLRGASLIPFVLLASACVSQSTYDAKVAENEQLMAENARLANAIRYTVNSDLLFTPGSWKMTAAGQEVIAKVASQLAPTQRRKVMVNGYTDNQPIGQSLMQAGVTSNEILSQKRAEAVRDYMISRGVNPDFVAAKGWGDQHPVAPNNTAEGRTQNRRVELTLVP